MRWLVTFDRAGARELGSDALSLTGLELDEVSTSQSPAQKVVFSGVLYNREALCRVLSFAEPLASLSNAELVLAAYKRWDENFIEEIEGIFSLLVWDSEANRLLVFRDPLGVRPLFYSADHNHVLFSDSSLLLLEQPRVSGEVNRVLLAEVLWRRWHSKDETYFQAVKRVPPGHVLIVKGTELEARRYWVPAPPGTPDDSMTESDLQAFDGLLEQAVARAMAQGSTGIFLSGGLDSVSVAAVAMDLSVRWDEPTPLALSVAFAHPDADETVVQRSVAEQLGMSQILMPFAEGSGEAGLVRTALALDASWPSPLQSIWRPIYFNLAARARAHGRDVILTGGGGDEWLTVNPSYMADLVSGLQLRSAYRLGRAIVNSYRLPILAQLRFLLWRSALRPLGLRQARIIGGRFMPKQLNAMRLRRMRHANQLPYWLAPDPELRAQLMQRLEAYMVAELERPETRGPYTFYKEEGMIFSSFDHPLISLDREEDFEAGRRLGLSLLHPYWDAQLVSFLARVPPRLLLLGGREKGLVRQSVARRFPPLGFEKQKKVVAARFVQDMLKETGPAIWQELKGTVALGSAGIVDADEVDTTFRQGIISDSNYAVHRIWELLNLETWTRANTASPSTLA